MIPNALLPFLGRCGHVQFHYHVQFSLGVVTCNNVIDAQQDRTRFSSNVMEM